MTQTIVDKERWNWCMNYCKRKGLPPAQEFAWKEAKKMYHEMTKKEK